MEEKNYELTRVVLTKGVREWVDGNFITNPLKSWDSIQKTAYEIWNYLDLDGSGSFLNKKPNGEPIFYLNADDPNKLLEIGPNKTVGDVAVSLEGQIIAAVNRGNIKFDKVPTKSSRHSHKPSENVWYKVEFESTLEHIDYMWFTKYTDEGCPEKGKSFFRNVKGNLSNWPRGLTSLMKENEEIERAKKAEKEKEKRDKEKEIDEWIKGCGDGTGTKEGFILCQKYSQLVEEVKAEYPKRVADNDTGFIERTVRDRLKPAKAKAPEVKQATKEEVLGTEFNPTKVLEKMFKREIAEGKQIRVTNFRSIKSENYVCYLLFEVEGHPLIRSTRTKNKRRAKAILKEGKKMFNSQEPANKEPEVKPEQMEAMETIETTKQESSAWSWLNGLFGKNEQVKVIDEPNEELEETRWDEPNEPEPVLEAAKDLARQHAEAKEVLDEAAAKLKELEAKMEEAKKSEAEEEREELLARIAELDKQISNGRT